MLQKLTKDEFDQKVKNFNDSPGWKFEGEKPIILKFSAQWCGPCKSLTPVIEALQGEYENKVDVYEIDTDEAPELAVTFGIRSVPTLIFFPVGENCFKKVGALPINMLRDIIKQSFKLL